MNCGLALCITSSSDGALTLKLAAMVSLEKMLHYFRYRNFSVHFY